MRAGRGRSPFKSGSPAGVGKPCTVWLFLANKPIRHISRDALLLDLWLDLQARAQRALGIPADVVEWATAAERGQSAGLT